MGMDGLAVQSSGRQLLPQAAVAAQQEVQWVSEAYAWDKSLRTGCLMRLKTFMSVARLGWHPTSQHKHLCRTQIMCDKDRVCCTPVPWYGLAVRPTGYVGGQEQVPLSPEA